MTIFGESGIVLYTRLGGAVFCRELGRGRALVALFCVGALAGCFEEDVRLVEEIAVEAAGYSVPRPDGFEAVVVGDELQLTEAGDLRAPRGIRVRPVEAGAVLTGDVERRGDVVYQVVDTGSGSGGVVWDLTAVKPLEAMSVEIVASLQTEERRPKFGWAWPVIEGIEVVE
ncbi:Tsi3 family protein [Aestuariibius sp. 2305UL40-4]|uniref:Tsi3 family protein n=1 Tax=Aestuariibius violaceus TaxID=3234132 RepID=UPI00345E0FA6